MKEIILIAQISLSFLCALIIIYRKDKNHTEGTISAMVRHHAFPWNLRISNWPEPMSVKIVLSAYCRQACLDYSVKSVLINKQSASIDNKPRIDLESNQCNSVILTINRYIFHENFHINLPHRLVNFLAYAFVGYDCNLPSLVLTLSLIASNENSATNIKNNIPMRFISTLIKRGLTRWFSICFVGFFLWPIHSPQRILEFFIWYIAVYFIWYQTAKSPSNQYSIQELAYLIPIKLPSLSLLAQLAQLEPLLWWRMEFLIHHDFLHHFFTLFELYAASPANAAYAAPSSKLSDLKSPWDDRTIFSNPWSASPEPLSSLNRR